MLPISLNLERKHLYLHEKKKSFSQTCSKTPGSKSSAEHPFVVIQQTLASGGDRKRGICTTYALTHKRTEQLSLRWEAHEYVW